MGLTHALSTKIPILIDTKSVDFWHDPIPNRSASSGPSPVLDCRLNMAYQPIEIAPSILAADFARLGEQIREAESGGADVIHFDVMDGHFVPNISIGIPVLQSIRKATRLPLDVHLMIENPERYIDAFVRAGANRVLVHQEATPHLDRALAMIREAGAEAGAVINPSTPVAMLQDVLDKVDTVLVMSVNPGFGGQKFIPRATEKVMELNQLRVRRRANFRIAVDGGVELEHTPELARAGANTLIAGTSIFHTPDPAEAVRKMRRAALEATRQMV
jgi:ribulose-phosphate 3-epimerase